MTWFFQQPFTGPEVHYGPICPPPGAAIPGWVTRGIWFWHYWHRDPDGQGLWQLEISFLEENRPPNDSADPAPQMCRWWCLSFKRWRGWGAVQNLVLGLLGLRIWPDLVWFGPLGEGFFWFANRRWHYNLQEWRRERENVFPRGWVRGDFASPDGEAAGWDFGDSD